MKFFNPYEEIRVTEHYLPHWQQPGAAYFLTFRLADSLPRELLKEWERERSDWWIEHPPPLAAEDEMEYHRRFSHRIDQWLDAGYGSCLLRETSFREVVEQALAYFSGQRYDPLAWVIMPNHVHVCCVLHPDWLLEKVLFTWKRHTAGAINRLLGKDGPFWMHDYFDRLIRDGNHLRNVIRYIRRNPLKACLKEGDYSLWEGELAKAVK